MKALILCAGKGTRLRPLTFTSAKHLIPVANKPILMYSLEAIKKADIEEIGLVVSPENAEDFEKRFGDGSTLGLKISYIVQHEPKGLAHAVAVSKDFLGDDDFLMYLGDNLISVDLKEFVDEFRAGNYDAYVLLTSVDDPTRFGVVVLKEGKIVEIVEKPKVPPSNLAIVGVYLFTNKIFEGVMNIKPSWRGEYEITDAIGYLVKKGYNVSAKVIYGWWKDTGKPEDLIEANRKILEEMNVSSIRGNVDHSSIIQGRVQIGEETMVMDSVIRGPVIIGSGARIRNAYVGPYTSIGNNVVLEDCEIENSIVLDETSIIRIPSRIDSSVFGRNVLLTTSDTKPRIHRFVLGDYSKVELI